MGLESLQAHGKTPVDGLLAPQRVALVRYFGMRSEAHCSLHLKEFVKLSCSADRLLGYQIDADGFRFSGLLIDTNFEADGFILCNLIALAQCRHVEENVHAPVGRFDEAEAFFVVPHLNFAGWHLSIPSFSPGWWSIRRAGFQLTLMIGLGNWRPKRRRRPPIGEIV
jgi:hypothetical protein